MIIGVLGSYYAKIITFVPYFGPMWTQLSHTIIKYRLIFVLILGLVTAFMGYKSAEIEWSYDLAKVVPEDDPDMVTFSEFKELFGEDGNLVAVSLKDSSVFEVENFNRFRMLSEEISKLTGITEVVSLPLIVRLVKDTKNRKFELEPIFPEWIDSQEQLDSLMAVALEQKFYSGQLINEDNGAVLLLVGIDKSVLNTEYRIQLTQDIVSLGDAFSDHTGIKLHYAGLPFVRSVIAGGVKKEMTMFIYFSVIITGLIMLMFFRSFYAVIFPLTIIGVVVIWVLGTLVLFDYKITILSGLIPPVIVVIGIPNSIYLLNKYHHEFLKHGNKVMAISRVTRKIGFTTLMTNFTTAIGFGVLGFTDIIILKEFGIVAGINILATFLVSIVIIPSVFSWLPPPSRRQMRHLEFKPLGIVLHGLDLLVHRYKYRIFFVTSIIVVVSVIGLYKVDSISYMVDDIPAESQVKKDLEFFESNFSGIMPLEVVVDLGQRRGITNLNNLRKLDEFEEFLSSQEHISKPVSIVSFIKAARQAYYNNNPNFYNLPNSQDRAFILRYFRNQSDSSGLLKSFVDSTGQVARISLKIADIGSNKMDSLVNDVIEPEKARIFEGTDIQANVTGTTPLFIKGNKFLIENLQFSFVLAFLIISLIMAALFANWKMITISLIPNIIPLMITAAIMGYFNIPLKPSTAIVFSITFGISVDYSIHFLAKYRQELFANKFFVPVAVSKSLTETGTSMIYTSIVLFAGFVIFVASDFGGTVALGILTSTTLFIAMLANLIVLPSLLLAFDSGKRKKDSHPLIEQYEEFYHEEEDEEIDLEKIEIQGERESIKNEN